jgi:hypothetical protein
MIFDDLNYKINSSSLVVIKRLFKGKTLFLLTGCSEMVVKNEHSSLWTGHSVGKKE